MKKITLGGGDITPIIPEQPFITQDNWVCIGSLNSLIRRHNLPSNFFTETGDDFYDQYRSIKISRTTDSWLPSWTSDPLQHVDFNIWNITIYDKYFDKYPEILKYVKYKLGNKTFEKPSGYSSSTFANHGINITQVAISGSESKLDFLKDPTINIRSTSDVTSKLVNIRSNILDPNDKYGLRIGFKKISDGEWTLGGSLENDVSTWDDDPYGHDGLYLGMPGPSQNVTSYATYASDKYAEDVKKVLRNGATGVSEDMKELYIWVKLDI